MEISPMKSALFHAERRKNGKQIGRGKFCRGKLWLNSEAQTKNRLVFTFNKFSTERSSNGPSVSLTENTGE